MVEQSRAEGRKSLGSLHVRVERVTSRSAEPLWPSKPGADIVRGGVTRRGVGK